MHQVKLEEALKKEQVTLRIADNHQNDLLVPKSSELYQRLKDDNDAIKGIGFTRYDGDKVELIQISSFDKCGQEKDDLVYYHVGFELHDNFAFCKLVIKGNKNDNKRTSED